MQKSLLDQYIRKRALPQFFSDYWSICGSIHRKNKLENLIKWAKRKRLTPQRNYYQRCLIEEDDRLFRYRIRPPYATVLAEVAVLINTVLNPQCRPHRQYRKSYRYS